MSFPDRGSFRRLFRTHFLRCLALLGLAIGVTGLAACADGGPSQQNDTADALADIRDTGQDMPGPSCTPNLDGTIVASELGPAVGIPVSYGVTLSNNGVPVDLAGEDQGDGTVRWDWSQARPGEEVRRLAAADLSGKWYADSFPEDAFVVAFDVDATTEAIYRHRQDGLFLLGIASAEEEPSNGQTLLVYDDPVLLYQFPLQAGDSWVSVGEIRNAVAFGLPYAGRDLYNVEVQAIGQMVLPDLTFEQVLKVRTQVTLQPAVGASSTQYQVSFLFECFGEVARATSLPNPEEPDFDLAAEVRRLAL